MKKILHTLLTGLMVWSGTQIIAEKTRQYSREDENGSNYKVTVTFNYPNNADIKNARDMLAKTLNTLTDCARFKDHINSAVSPQNNIVHSGKTKLYLTKYQFKFCSTKSKDEIKGAINKLGLKISNLDVVDVE